MIKNSISLNERPAFADILKPVSEEEFFAEYYDRKILHVEGDSEKFANMMSWKSLTSILNVTAAWSATSLQLLLDTEVVPPRTYCRSAKNRDGATVQQPDSEKVMALLRQGASLVANDVDTLTPGLRGVADALEAALSAKAQANLYCSRKARQAFGSHFDTHDVYAMHVAGEKLWRFYENRMDTPIAHPQFKSYGRKWHEENKGDIVQEILMRPGDLLYIPRGQYHDALAMSGGTIHVSFGVTHVIGIDAFELFSSIAVTDPLFRSNMPRPGDGGSALANWLASLGARIKSYSEMPDSIAAIQRFQREFHYPRAGFELPVATQNPQYRLAANGLKVKRRGGGWILAGANDNKPIPAELVGAVSWVIDRKAFTRAELQDAFPEMTGSDAARLLDELAAMKVVIHPS